MSIEAIGDCGGDWFDLDFMSGSSTLRANGSDKEVGMWEQRLVTYDPNEIHPHHGCMLAMMRAPDHASVSGGYSQERGGHVEFQMSWDNSPSESSSDKSPSKGETESSSKSDSKSEDSSSKESASNEKSEQ